MATRRMLGNKIGLEEKTATTPTVVYRGFMRHVFNMEKDYIPVIRTKVNDIAAESLVTNARFYADVVVKKRARLRHHLTKADIFTAIILQRVCVPKEYYISNVTYSILYDALTENFEPHYNPETGEIRPVIGYQEFVYSMEKFRVNGLIQVSERANGNLDIQLLHIEGKDRAYVVLDSAFFSRAFTTESVAHMKFALAVTLQAGRNERNWFKRRLYDEYTESKTREQDERHMMDRGLLQFLHKTQGSDIRAIVETWMSKPFFGSEPLLLPLVDGSPFMEKRGRRFVQVACRLNPVFAINPEKETDKQYHRVITAPKRHKRLITALQTALEKEGIADFVAKHTEQFQELLQLALTKGRVMAKSKITELAAYIKQKSALPASFTNFINRTLLSNKGAKVIEIARDAAIYDWIAPGVEIGSAAYMERKHQFIRAILNSFKSLRDVRKAFHKASYAIRHKASEFQYRRSEYETNSVLLTTSAAQVSVIEATREMAYAKQVNPVDYCKLEMKYVSVIVEEGLQISYLAQSLQSVVEHMESLTEYDFVAYPLEQFVLQFSSTAKNAMA